MISSAEKGKDDTSSVFFLLDFLGTDILLMRDFIRMYFDYFSLTSQGNSSKLNAKITPNQTITKMPINLIYLVKCLVE
jgi:hypothetical protein